VWRADVVTALRLSSLDQLATQMRGQRAARGPIEPAERAESRRLLAKTFPDHAQRCSERADRVLGGELYLFGAWRDHARGELAPGIAAFDWTRDPLAGGHAPARPAIEMNRDAPGTDSRAVWEAARLTAVTWLAQAHTVAGLPGTERSRGARQPGLYARAAVAQIRDFLATQPVGFGIHWTCPMEASLRLLNILGALLLLRDAPELDAFFWAEVTEGIVRHARFIHAELEDGQVVPGNHLLTDLAGLAAVGCLFPELPGALNWRAWALPAFAGQLLRQTSEEGLAFEGSLAYHRFATELGLLVHAFARRQGLSLGAHALKRLWRMCELLDAATLPDGRVPAIGDNDGTHAFSYELRGALETSHIGALCAALDGPGTPRSVEPESLWLGGLSGLRRNIVRLAAGPLPRPPRFTASGLTVLLGSGGRGASLWAGENGQHGLGGHAHNDKLACEIVLNGRRVSIDPGCPVYIRDRDERDRFRSTAFHPTLQVDETEQAPIPLGRPFMLPDAARAALLRSDGETASAEHCGYLRLRPGVLHRREVSLPRGQEAVCVTDWVLGDGVHVIDLRWPLPSRGATLRRATPAERALLSRLEASPSGVSRFDTARVFALGWPGEEGTFAVLAVACEQPWDAVVEESTWSPGYGERVCARTAHVRLRASCPAVLTSAFVRVRPVHSRAADRPARDDNHRRRPAARRHRASTGGEK
jgi:hypothetical protein